jgi:hypothetical protein
VHPYHSGSRAAERACCFRCRHAQATCHNPPHRRPHSTRIKPSTRRVMQCALLEALPAARRLVLQGASKVTPPRLALSMAAAPQRTVQEDCATVGRALHHPTRNRVRRHSSPRTRPRLRSGMAGVVRRDYSGVAAPATQRLPTEFSDEGVPPGQKTSPASAPWAQCERPVPVPAPPAAAVGSVPPPDTDSPLLRNLESR